jgi:hypothetical protein
MIRELVVFRWRVPNPSSHLLPSVRPHARLTGGKRVHAGLSLLSGVSAMVAQQLPNLLMRVRLLHSAHNAPALIGRRRGSEPRSPGSNPGERARGPSSGAMPGDWNSPDRFMAEKDGGARISLSRCRKLLLGWLATRFEP